MNLGLELNDRWLTAASEALLPPSGPSRADRAKPSQMFEESRLTTRGGRALGMRSRSSSFRVRPMCKRTRISIPPLECLYFIGQPNVGANRPINRPKCQSLDRSGFTARRHQGLEPADPPLRKTAKRLKQGINTSTANIRMPCRALARWHDYSLGATTFREYAEAGCERCRDTDLGQHLPNARVARRSGPRVSIQRPYARPRQ